MSVPLADGYTDDTDRRRKPPRAFFTRVDRYTALLLMSVCPSVCLSVNPSHSWATPRQFKISKYVLRHTIVWCFWFLEAKFLAPEFRGSLPRLPTSVLRINIAHLSTAQIWTKICNNLKTVKDKWLIDLLIHTYQTYMQTIEIWHSIQWK